MILKLKSQIGSRKGIEVLHGSHVAWQDQWTLFFLWEQMFFLMQNIFIIPAMQNLYIKTIFAKFQFGKLWVPYEQAI